MNFMCSIHCMHCALYWQQNNCIDTFILTLTSVITVHSLSRDKAHWHLPYCHGERDDPGIPDLTFPVMRDGTGMPDDTASSPQPHTLCAEACGGLRLWQLDLLRASDVSVPPQLLLVNTISNAC